MDTTTIVILSIVGFLFLACMVGVIYGLPGLVSDFPKEWEDEEDAELERKIKEYKNKKSQD